MTDSQYKRFGLPEDHALQKLANRNRRNHLAFINEIRQGTRPKPAEMPVMGRVVLSIPELDFYVLKHRFPDLASPDNEIRTRAYKKFLASPLSEPYRINRRGYD